MPRVVTSIHDPCALAVLGDRLGLAPPVERSVWLDTEEVFGWVVLLGDRRHPVVCDRLTGLVAYHPTDNAHDHYARRIRFVERYDDLRPKLRRGDRRPAISGGRRVARRGVA